MPKQLVPCLFCGEIPCECKGKRPSPKKQPVIPPSVSTPVPSPPTDPDISPDWFASSKPKLEAPEVHQTQDELLLREALRNLESIMSPGSKQKYQDLMYPKKDAKLARIRAEVRESLG